MKVQILFFTSIILMMLYSCSRERDEFLTVTPIPMSKDATEYFLDNIISGWYIDPYLSPENSERFPSLKERSDLRYLPYYYDMFNENRMPYKIASKNSFFFDGLPFYSQYADSALFNAITSCIQRYYRQSSHNKKLFEPTEEYELRNGRHSYDSIAGEIFNIDSLRVRIVAYNDRSALEKIEKYYTERNYLRELAIYYKVMLSYDGNGDLAEKFYNVLKPYLIDKEQYWNSIRKVLLRAAICDRNERAQFLCDSLGFSLCDYKLPVPCKD